MAWARDLPQPEDANVNIPCVSTDIFIAVFVCVCVWGAVSEVWIQGFALARQVLYCLNHNSSPFTAIIAQFGNSSFASLPLIFKLLLILVFLE
jgi:hypothetical protein